MFWRKKEEKKAFTLSISASGYRGVSCDSSITNWPPVQMAEMGLYESSLIAHMILHGYADQKLYNIKWT